MTRRFGPSGQPNRETLRRVAVCAVALLLLAAALSKAIQPAPVSLSIAHLLQKAPIVPTVPNVYAGVVALVIIEIAVAANLAMSRDLRRSASISLGLLIPFTAGLLVLTLDPTAPDCGCFGNLRLAENAQTANLISLVRNVVLIAACAWIVITAPGAARKPQ